MARRNSKSAPRVLQIREKEERAFQLRMQGVSFDDIARQIGFKNRSSAFKAFTRHLTRHNQETAEEVSQRVTLAESRLDRLIATYFPRAIGRVPTGQRDEQGNPIYLPPDAEAAKIVIHIERRRARLRGLDAPERLNLGGHDGGPLDLNSASDTLAAALDKIAATFDPEGGDQGSDRESETSAP